MAGEDASDGRGAGGPRLVAPGVADLPREALRARLGHYQKTESGHFYFNQPEDISIAVRQHARIDLADFL
jgi:hypothetical protein